ncbi:MAG: cytochrome c biogenesis protein ResB [Verrucomicrobia bacterium]|nr:cytochrome c biogenesis protein ResB [Verrucomicrobiota bacterium]
MKDLLTSLRDFFVSLKLTVALLVFGMILVFAGTLDQVNLGIWATQEKYFRSFIVYTRVGDFAVPVFPGGYLIGGLLLINLVAAHVYRFTFTWRKSGIQLAHAGLILLLIGELLSGLWQKDFAMRLTESESKNYAEAFRENELAIIDATDDKFDEVVAIPEPLLAKKSPIQHPKLPFRVVPKTYYPNSVLSARKADSPVAAEATAGFGERILAAPQPMTYKTDERNLPTAFVELAAPDKSLGTYLVSLHLVMPQEFEYGGRKWKLILRTARIYQPFSLTLLKFNHDRYAGTDIPKNFSSRLKLQTPDGRDDREVLIYMNNPLRYAGLTFYQSGYEGERTTILQVVHNPSWLVPYVACTLMTLGLAIQFGIHLLGFAGRRAPQAATATA